MPIMIWGHRGHRHHRVPDKYDTPPYENSLRAYQETLATCHGIECDVIQSRQATAFLIHDTMFNGMVKYQIKTHLSPQTHAYVDNQFIYQMFDEDISKLRLIDGQSIPRLRQLLEMMPNYPDKIINLELKGPNTADVALRTIERAILDQLITPDQVIFSSFNFPLLRYLRSHAGYRYKICVLFSPEGAEMSQMFPNWPYAEQDAFYVPMGEETLQRPDLKEIDPDFFNLPFQEINLSSLHLLERYYPRASMILWAGFENHPDNDTSVIDTVQSLNNTNKIFAIISDYPDEIRKRLEMRNIAVKAA